MKRVLGLAAIVGAALAAGATPAAATNECRGLRVCVHVAGPWVVVPADRGARRHRVEYRLSCPRGYLVGGLDAELSDRAIDVAFFGRLGSPIAPGITTSRAVVFVATFVGASARSPSFRPRLGCVPGSGGGSRIPTSASAFPPGQPAVRRVRTLRIRPGRGPAVAVGCRSGERLVGGSHAVGFYTKRPPAARLVASVAATQAFARDHVTVVVRAGRALGRVPAVVQVTAICAGGQ